jgi:pimeloyl-ACP methyl ester carboxylesterase
VTSPTSDLGLVERRVPTSLGPMTVHAAATRSSDTALILVHGAAGSWRTWRELLRRAEDGGDPLRDVVAVDLPGWGASGALARPTRATVDDMTETLVTAAEACGYSRWRVLGHSMGGLLALHLACREPVRTVGVLCVSASLAGVLESLRAPMRTLGRRGRLPALVLLRFALAAVAPIEPPIRALVRGLGRMGLVRLLAAPLFRHPLQAPADTVRDLAVDLRPRSFVAAALAVRDYDVGRWRAIVAPVVALSGDRDRFTARGDLDGLRELLPTARTEVLEDCGHFPQVEQPERLLSLLRELSPSDPGCRSE